MTPFFFPLNEQLFATLFQGVNYLWIPLWLSFQPYSSREYWITKCMEFMPSGEHIFDRNVTLLCVFCHKTLHGLQTEAMTLNLVFKQGLNTWCAFFDFPFIFKWLFEILRPTLILRLLSSNTWLFGRVPWRICSQNVVITIMLQPHCCLHRLKHTWSSFKLVWCV